MKGDWREQKLRQHICLHIIYEIYFYWVLTLESFELMTAVLSIASNSIIQLNNTIFDDKATICLHWTSQWFLLECSRVDQNPNLLQDWTNG